MSRLDALVEAMKWATTMVIDEMERLYPEGYEVQVLLSSRQVSPSPGVVIGHHIHCGGACVKVRLDRYKEFGRMRSRSIPVKDIVALGGPRE